MLEIVIDSFAKAALSVTEALRGGLDGATEPPAIAELLELCRIVKDKAKDPAQ